MTKMLQHQVPLRMQRMLQGAVLQGTVLLPWLLPVLLPSQIHLMLRTVLQRLGQLWKVGTTTLKQPEKPPLILKSLRTDLSKQLLRRWSL